MIGWSIYISSQFATIVNRYHLERLGGCAKPYIHYIYALYNSQD